MEGLDYDYWHIFAVEWDPTSITWYVDGKKMWSYLKSTKQSELEDGQWPFDAPFYLILNQSVGSGAWAKPADTSFTYETQFDWSRELRRCYDLYPKLKIVFSGSSVMRLKRENPELGL